MNWLSGRRRSMPNGYRDVVRKVAREMRDSEAIEDYYEELIAVWDIQHDADRAGYTARQRARRVLWTRATNAGLSPERIVFARLLVNTGRLDEYPATASTGGPS